MPVPSRCAELPCRRYLARAEELSATDTADSSLNYGVVVDCGSSGSRVFVYFWPPHNGNPHDLLDIKQMRDRNSRPVVKKIKPGACRPFPAPSRPCTDLAHGTSFPRHLRDGGRPRAGHPLPAAPAAVRGRARPRAETQGDAAVHPVHGGDAAAARAVSARLARDVPGSLSPEERQDSCLLLGPAGESRILWERVHCRDEWRGMQKEGLSLLGGS